MILKAAYEGEFSSYAMVILKMALRSITVAPVQFVRSEPGAGVLGFGVDSEYTTLSPVALANLVTSERVLVKDLREYFGLPPEKRLEPRPGNNLYFDIESHSADELWNLPPEEFFRLGQYAWGANGEVILTTDLEEMRSMIRKADLVIGHNIHAFDLTAIFGKDSTEPLEMARDNRVFDTFVYAQQSLMAPDFFMTRAGHRQFVRGPGEMMKWYALDNLAFQLDVGGKIGDLKAMAKEHGGFCHIPIDDPEYLEYAEQDVVVQQEVTHELLSIKKPGDYDWREQQFAGVCAQISRNGFKVDIAKATARRDYLQSRKEELMAQLVRDYNFPTEGKQPWRSNAGKAAILNILKAGGIDPDKIKDWPKLKTGPSLGGKVLLEHTEGTKAEDLGKSLAELMGQRSLSQLALDSVQSDGFTHPDISFLQRSGRSSVQRPGLTVWSSNNDPGKGNNKSIEKSYFVPDSADELLVEMDYSNADGRIVAAYSGDTVFLERMTDDFDSHEMSGRLLFGDRVYDTDPKFYRNTSKPASHGWAYRAGVAAIMRGTKVSDRQASNFIKGMDVRYAGVKAWQDRMSVLGEVGWLENDWGRKMIVTDGKSFTQSPALMGQSGTREIMVDALIKMLHFSIEVVKWLKVTVHDAIVFSIPIKDLDWGVPKCRELMETSWQPSDGSGQLIEFPVSAGVPSTDWEKAGH